jgi:hypothetical protein
MDDDLEQRERQFDCIAVYWRRISPRATGSSSSSSECLWFWHVYVLKVNTEIVLEACGR